MSWNRRRLLQAGGALAGVSAASLLMGRVRAQEAPADPAAEERGAPPARIALRNLHTDERLEIKYSREGIYIPAALSAIELLLRDFRTGEAHAIDPALLDYLVAVARTAGVDPKFDVISGYRSPQTNAMLHANNEGVAVHSLHIDGMAADIRVPGRSLASLRRTAIAMHGGGVGYYPASEFVHVDSGRVRYW